MDMLESYQAALRAGWSPHTMRPEAAPEQLAAIARSPERFLASLVDLEATGPAILQPDGTTAQRLPGYYRWMWDGEFCGSINFRFQPGTHELPAHVLGHVGYSVVPWKRRRGYATSALASVLDDARARGLPEVEITTDLDNVGSQRVIEHNGGISVGNFTKVGADGQPVDSVRYRVRLD